METVEKTHLVWQDVCEDPKLQDLPFKIELTANGTLLMSPRRLKHGQRQHRIARLIEDHVPHVGTVIPECAIRTEDGTRVADVGWFSSQRWQVVEDEYEASVAPEICVEVLSPGNTVDEMNRKRKLYFVAGAAEVWICDIAGHMHFFNASGSCAAFRLVPTFPQHLDL